MTDLAGVGTIDVAESPKPKLDQPLNPLGLILFFGVMAAGFLFVAYSLYVDVGETGEVLTTYLPFLLLFVALVIALGFEFVNGFHDTANAVATVIYTHSLPAPVAVVWSGFFNFLGVLISSGGVAFGIVSLLPVELILQVGSSAGFAMVFARRCHVEPRYLVLWFACLQFAHFNRVDYRGRHCEPVDGSEDSDQWS